jgi:Cu+-exporting ATPase
MFKDPVCGMNVTPETAAGKYEYKGETYYFCSTYCLGQFKANPDKYIGEKTAEDVGAIQVSPPEDDECRDGYVCPMHPEEKSDKPSSCRK